MIAKVNRWETLRLPKAPSSLSVSISWTTSVGTKRRPATSQMASMTQRATRLLKNCRKMMGCRIAKYLCVCFVLSTSQRYFPSDFIYILNICFSERFFTDPCSWRGLKRRWNWPPHLAKANKTKDEEVSNKVEERKVKNEISYSSKKVISMLTFYGARVLAERAGQERKQLFFGPSRSARFYLYPSHSQVYACTLKISGEFAHEEAVEPDDGDLLAHSHGHAHHGDEQIGHRQVDQKVIGHAVRIKINKK